MVKLTSWVRPKDVPVPMHPLALHIGPWQDVLRMSGRFSRTSSGRPRNVIFPNGYILKHQKASGCDTSSMKWVNNKSTPPEVFLGKDVLKICSKFTGIHPCRSAISIKLQSNFIEIVLRHGCSLVNIQHIFRTPFLKDASGGVLL